MQRERIEFLGDVTEESQTTIHRVGNVIHGLGTVVKERLQFARATFDRDFGFTDLSPEQSSLLETGPLRVHDIMQAAKQPAELSSPTPEE